MLKFVKLQLGQGWVADSNSPEPQVSVEASSVNVRFRSYRVVDDKKPTGILRALGLFSKSSSKFEETWSTLRFAGCSRWRWDSTNDHEWYKVDGHGRHSGAAPRWGEFYELIGPDPDPDHDALSWEKIGADTTTSRHFLYYFRDETLEFMAEDWSFFPS
ncbi:hypothetical protein V6R98_14565 [Agrobacterium sp. CCNWLW71]|uniref:hypothetical protein n=1 Tax=unclassified Agrobacterium TaxID=2632611 RepID=UPI002FEED2AE